MLTLIGTCCTPAAQRLYPFGAQRVCAPCWKAKLRAWCAVASVAALLLLAACGGAVPAPDRLSGNYEGALGNAFHLAAYLSTDGNGRVTGTVNLTEIGAGNTYKAELVGHARDGVALLEMGIAGYDPISVMGVFNTARLDGQAFGSGFSGDAVTLNLIGQGKQMRDPPGLDP